MIQIDNGATLRHEIESLILRHGAIRTIRTLLCVLCRRGGTKVRRSETSKLPDHLRRDIGLPPAQPVGRHWRGLP